MFCKVVIQVFYRMYVTKMNSLNRISFNSLFNLNYLHIKTSLLQKSLGKSKKDHWQDD